MEYYSSHEPGLVAFQSVKPVAQYRTVRDNILAGNDYRCPCYIRPTAGCVNVGHGLECKITVAGGPAEDRASCESLNGQGWAPKFNGPDVAAVAASIGDGGEVERSWRAALVGGGTEIFALVDSGAAGAQRASTSWSAKIGRASCRERV